MKKARILLADVFGTMRCIFREILSQEPDMEVVGEVGDAQDALRVSEDLGPDIAVLDMGMLGLDCLQVIGSITGGTPGKTKVLVSSMYHDKRLAKATCDAGASGYMLKARASEELIPAIRTLMQGETYTDVTI